MSSSHLDGYQFSLKIERGRTRHPERPISDERFLIGAGSNCHLQLGGEMPILHSVIIQTEAGLWIDSVVREPQLLVNRQPVRETQLFAGDLLEIGNFVFTVQVAESVGNTPELTEDESVDLRDLNAEDLVDLLAIEMDQLAQIENVKESGARALLEAARNTSNDEISDRLAELNRREAVLAEKAEHLQKAQARLEQYLEKLQTKISPEAETDGDKPYLKTA